MGFHDILKSSFLNIYICIRDFRCLYLQAPRSPWNSGPCQGLVRRLQAAKGLPKARQEEEEQGEEQEKTEVSFLNKNVCQNLDKIMLEF